MTRKSDKLSKWDEAWLNDSNQDKWDYVLEYIRVRWPLEVTQGLPISWSGEKQSLTRELFGRLLQETQFDTRGIIRRTKEAWRRHHNESLKRRSGSYTNVKLTAADKNKMRVLAEEAGLSSVSEVVSSILNGEHKELIANKKAERDAAIKDRAVAKDKTILSGFVTNFKLKKINEEKSKLKHELEFTKQKLAVLADLFSKQLVTLERYEDDGITPLTDAELARARELNQDMLKSFEEEVRQIDPTS